MAGRAEAHLRRDQGARRGDGSIHRGPAARIRDGRSSPRSPTPAFEYQVDGGEGVEPRGSSGKHAQREDVPGNAIEILRRLAGWVVFEASSRRENDRPKRRAGARFSPVDEGSADCVEVRKGRSTNTLPRARTRRFGGRGDAGRDLHKNAFKDDFGGE